MRSPRRKADPRPNIEPPRARGFLGQLDTLAAIAQSCNCPVHTHCTPMRSLNSDIADAFLSHRNMWAGAPERRAGCTRLVIALISGPDVLASHTPLADGPVGLLRRGLHAFATHMARFMHCSAPWSVPRDSMIRLRRLTGSLDTRPGCHKSARHGAAHRSQFRRGEDLWCSTI
jgi:hypothetical protein